MKIARTWDELETQFKRKHNFRQIEKSCFSCRHRDVCIVSPAHRDGVCVCDAYESEVNNGSH